MRNSIYDGDCLERATSRDSLETRLRINRQNSSADFDGWLMGHLDVRPGEDILDVGCGTGAQTLPFAAKVGSTGSVSALDLSAQSIAQLKANLPANTNVEAVVSDMSDLQTLIDSVFSVKRYDLAQSAYSLYYCSDRNKVLDAMRGALKPGGRLAVFTPDAPHGLVNFAAQFSKIPAPVLECFEFGQTVLYPYFDKNFKKITIHKFHNVVSFTDTATVMDFYRVTTYYDAKVDAAFAATVDAEIARTGRFSYEKNGYLIIGQ